MRAFFIAKRIRSNVRELEGALRRNRQLTFTGRAVALEFTKEALKDLLSLQAKLVTVENIQKTVATTRSAWPETSCWPPFGGTTAPGGMALAKELTSHSLPEIGDAFAGRDHTTVLHACKRIKELRDTEDGADEGRLSKISLKTLAG